MKIKQLTLYTHLLEEEKLFQTSTLGFPLINETAHSFSVQVGYSQFKFVRSEEKNIYHYCFLIPCNQLNPSIDWLKKRLDIIEITTGKFTQKFDSWNAESVYFYDASGNLAEFIVRHNLQNQSEDTFSTNSIIGLNEIGLPTKNIISTNKKLSNELGTSFWKGDKLRFGTNGDDNGIFLLPNYLIKTKWFPTNQKIETAPFQAIVENDGIEKKIIFENRQLVIE